MDFAFTFRLCIFWTIKLAGVNIEFVFIVHDNLKPFTVSQGFANVN